MNKLTFSKLLKFPQIWLDHGLLTDELFEFQISEFEKEYGDKAPSGGEEHWRYGAFHYWLRPNIDSKLLSVLLEVAEADSDLPMAGSMIRDIVKHPACNLEILNQAVAIVSKSKYYYSSVEELTNIFSSSRQQNP